MNALSVEEKSTISTTGNENKFDNDRNLEINENSLIKFSICSDFTQCPTY